MGTERTVRAHSAVTVHSSWASRCGYTLDGGTVGAGLQQGAIGEHRWGPGVALGRRSGGGAHPSGGSSCGGGAGCRRRGSGRRRGRGGSDERRGSGREAEKRGAGAVSERRGGIVARGRENSTGGGGFPFSKSGRRGGSGGGGRVSRATRGGRAGESEGGPSVGGGISA
jgi:hypothetical protein